MPAVETVGRGRRDNGQVPIAANPEKSGKEVALPRGVGGRGSQFIGGLRTDNELMRPAICYRNTKLTGSWILGPEVK